MINVYNSNTGLYEYMSGAKHALMTLNVTQSQLADLLGISKRTMTTMMSRSATKMELLAINALHVTQDDENNKYDAEGVYNDTLEHLKEIVESIVEHGASDIDVVLIDTCNEIIKAYKIGNYARVVELEIK